MSVLIRGMEMPKACWECPLKVHLFQRLWCVPSNKVINREDNTEREPDCPLVEVPTPHGRLIDADALIKELKECMYVANNNWEYEMVTGYSNAIESVEEACTIIEAEGSEDG